jgi:hypothetical protein
VLSPGSVQAVTGGFLENGLVANASLLCDPLGTLKIRDRYANRNGASRVLFRHFHLDRMVWTAPRVKSPAIPMRVLISVDHHQYGLRLRT